ncbi:MAG: hypothetical protein IPI59_15675 [Sphingobacteriales bacterium]|jgi:hypothetical protein|nr:hypothetical protein [Sphingobacteriales bacterium]MCC7057994.1 hypothetical protein [Chitinophagales bacterium]MDA0199968.1 hypothetical protein [Bacteroidota bacterium]MBK6888556.1 hypothetical protein [Sphingobacteriales bacterium]MBK7528936.1 hypothetical protein [Sphingobacteriales bacterium]
MLSHDILLTNDHDLQFEKGDLKVDLSDEQHIAHILVTDKGNWRQYPLLGVGLHRWLEADTSQEQILTLKNKIKQNLIYDNFDVKSIKIDTYDNIKIDAAR